MKTLEIRIGNPVALWNEIEDLVHLYCCVSETELFEKRYPELQRIRNKLKGRSEQILPQLKKGIIGSHAVGTRPK